VGKQQILEGALPLEFSICIYLHIFETFPAPVTTIIFPPAVQPKKRSCHLLQQPNALHLKDFLWLNISVQDNSQPIARSGHMQTDGTVDPWAYFVNSYVLEHPISTWLMSTHGIHDQLTPIILSVRLVIE